MPEMVAPRALVFRPLVKGNEALGMRLEEISLRNLHLWRMPEMVAPRGALPFSDRWTRGKKTLGTRLVPLQKIALQGKKGFSETRTVEAPVRGHPQDAKRSCP